jgi:hypothetical protein
VNEIMKRLLEISKVPAKNAAEWLSSAEDSVQFLKENGASEWTVIYASLPCVFIHAVLAPLKHLNAANHAELRGAFVNLGSSWMIEHESGGGEPDRVYLCSPLQRQGETLRDGEKLIFLRSFAGSTRSHFELSQKLVHALDVYYVQDRKAFCKLDENGDFSMSSKSSRSVKKTGPRTSPSLRFGPKISLSTCAYPTWEWWSSLTSRERTGAVSTDGMSRNASTAKRPTSSTTAV